MCHKVDGSHIVLKKRNKCVFTKEYTQNTFIYGKVKNICSQGLYINGKPINKIKETLIIKVQKMITSGTRGVELGLRTWGCQVMFYF